MAFVNKKQWRSLEQWSPVAFVVSGVGFLLAFVLLGWELVAVEQIPELLLSMLIIPSFFALFVVGLLGFYPYVASASPRLALGGVVTATIGGISLAVIVVGKVTLDLLGIVGFTEEGPLVGLLFVMLLAYLLSFLFYAVASVRTGRPSRIVGLLLLVIVVEPASGILFDIFGVELGATAPLVTLGIAAVAILAVGYLLRNEATPTDHAEPAPTEVRHGRDDS